jgi:hypothetical protein
VYEEPGLLKTYTREVIGAQAHSRFLAGTVAAEPEAVRELNAVA